MESKWAAVPVTILRQTFELQWNPLDNCAAACSCSLWREAVYSSSIQHVHLHIDKTRPEAWAAFLQSRACIDSLKVTYSAYSDTDHMPDSGTTASGAKLLASAFRCKHLMLDRNTVKLLPSDLHIPTELQKLSMHWPLAKSVSPDVAALPNLRQMEHLKDLEIVGPSKRCSDVFQDCVVHERIPGSLRSLGLHGISQMSGLNTASPYMLPKALLDSQQHPHTLRHLALQNCLFYLPNEHLSCLSRLDSLSLGGSEVCVDEDLCLSQLTNLTQLDLTSLQCYYDWGEDVEAHEAFEAWPSLKVLKLAHANVVCKDTVVQSLQVDELCVDVTLFSGMSASRTLPLHAAVSVDAWLGSELFEEWGQLDSTLVTQFHARVHTSECCRHGFLQFVQDCHSLQTFTFQDCDTSGFKLSIGPWLGQLKYLKDLSLVDVRCADLCFECLMSLTSLTLLNLEDDSMFSTLAFPVGLQELNFKGCCLFYDDVQHNLESLTQLTRLELGLMAGDCVGDQSKGHTILPAIPESIRRLVLCAWQTDPLYSPNWSVLEGCNNLEHLTVPAEQLSSDKLQTFVAGAKHLHVVDCYSPESVGNEQWR